MATYAQTLTEPTVFRKTNGVPGRQISVTPANSASRHLSYGRIILRDGLKSAAFYTASRETGLIVVSGRGRIEVSGQQFELRQYDAIYIPRDSAVHVRTDAHTDIAEFSAEVTERYPIQVVRYAAVCEDPGSKFQIPGPARQSSVTIILGQNIDAGRLVAGFTHSEPGNWIGWPPREHGALLEEVHVFFDMPDPAFGLQLVYQNPGQPEMVTVVHEGDAVVIPGGYHPSVAVPGHRIAFLWAMAAHREKIDRQFGVANAQPGFDAGGTGLEAGRP